MIDRCADAVSGRLPNFITIGTAKAGTTFLHAVLGAHPEVCLSSPKETWFFDGPAYDKGLETYASRHFSSCRNSSHVGEIATSYLYVPYVPARIAAALPSARLIAVLRDPIERAYSDWWMMHSRGYDQLSFDEAIRSNLNRLEKEGDFPSPSDWATHLRSIREGRELRYRTYVDYGFYDEQIDRYLAHFRPEQLLVLQFEKLVEHGLDAILELVLPHIGLDAETMPIGATSTPHQNPALPSYAVGRMIDAINRSGLGSWLPTWLTQPAKRLLSRTRPQPKISVETRALLTRVYRDRVRTVATHRIDARLWQTLQGTH